MNDQKDVRVRFAPSPTGWLHIGGLRTALYNFLFARRNGGVFVLRIEDTDRTRYVPGAVEAILRTLKSAGIEPDEGPRLEDGTIVERGDFGPYTQSDRLSIYKEHAERLVTEGQAYRCFCTAEALEAMREEQQAKGWSTTYDGRCRSLTADEVKSHLEAGRPHVIRLKAPRDGETRFTDVIRGEVSIPNSQIDDAVLLKTDGFPTYHLAVVIDDHLMGITHVIRGEEWIPSVPKHIVLYQAFGWDLPQFAHLPHLLNADRTKLSKRQGDVAVEDFLAKGYLPEAIVNFIALQGWNPSAEREIYELDDLVEKFDLAKVNHAGAIFNLEKLDWLNRHYLRELTPVEFARRATPFLAASGLIVPSEDPEEWVAPATGRIYSTEDLARVVELERERVSKISDLTDALEFVFKGANPSSDIIRFKTQEPVDAAQKLDAVKTLLESQESFDAPAIEAAIKGLIADKGWKNGETLWPLRVALTGREKSPGPFEVAMALGEEDTIDRINHAIGKLSKNDG